MKNNFNKHFMSINVSLNVCTLVYMKLLIDLKINKSVTIEKSLKLNHNDR